MNRHLLSDAQWQRIDHLLPGKPIDKGGRAVNNRLFVEAVLWIARTGSPWRDLPHEFGNWHSVYVRFSRWEAYGVWNRVAETLQHDADLEELFIDSTIVRAHQHERYPGGCHRAKRGSGRDSASLSSTNASKR